MANRKKQSFNILRDLKLTQKIFVIFLVMIFLVINSWGFTFTTIIDFQQSFESVESYAFPSVIATSELKDHVHISMLAVYDYVNTGNTASKELYQQQFQEAFGAEYELFLLSQSAKDFIFTQNFNDRLLAVYNATDELVKIYEANPDSPELHNKLENLNILRDEFNIFLENEVTNQIGQQIASTNEEINSTASTIRYFLIGVALIVILVIAFVLSFISNDIRKPLKTLTKAAEQFGKGNFVKIHLKRNDELGLFAKTFNKMGTDIAASQAALEEELEKTKKLDAQKSEFLSIAAHQLRTPMSGIRWVANMLFEGDMGELTKEQKHHLGNALENINRMVTLINDLLDVTKIEEQRFNYDFVQHDIVDITNNVIKRFENALTEKHLSIKVIHDTKKMQAEVDEDKLGIALENLIDNAIKYSHDKGKIEITIKKEKQHIICSVQDHGLGIAKESFDQVFTKFFRGQNILKVITEGSGLGLFVVKDIIIKHQGTVEFSSEEDKGSIFTFKIPIKQKHTDAEKMADKVRSDRTSDADPSTA